MDPGTKDFVAEGGSLVSGPRARPEATRRFIIPLIHHDAAAKRLVRVGRENRGG